MTNNENLTETLNDLVRINNDRVTGYDKAADQAKDIDIDLQAIFAKMASESHGYIRELDEAIVNLGGQPSRDSTFSGKIYRTWMDVKNTFTGSDRTSILASCEFGEDAAQTAYNDALETDAEMDATTRQLIMDQKNSLKNSHDIIKKYRDLNKAL
ncbi:MAG TPA: PA2169 family four-helix-bundle protein [Ferruginibacter sp.]|nr:PA2169 family four-helix-bundle protein [Ferruginibacter sp.]